MLEKLGRGSRCVLTTDLQIWEAERLPSASYTNYGLPLRGLFVRKPGKMRIFDEEAVYQRRAP